MEDSAAIRPLVVEGLVAGEPAALALPTGTVTFLLTDIESSTRRWEEDPGAMGADVPRHYDALGEAVTRHGGVRPLEQGEGDSVVAAFARASDAAAAALDAQRALLEVTPGLRVRMALHTGEAQLRDGQNYVGATVIRAARLRACARGGQVLVSDVAAGLIADRLPHGAGLVDLGTHRLRDLSRPERVWQLRHPDLPDDFGPLRSLDAFRHNLPAASTPLVGRSGELVELRGLVLDRRLVTITGSGGVGKTRLAQQLAADLVDEFPDGVCWVELAAVTDPDQVVPTLAIAVGVTESPGTPPLDVLLGHLRSSRLLLVVDNCEHLVDSVADLLGRVLDACPEVRIVATSRELIGVAGETTWRTPSLAVPSDPEAIRADAEAYDAVRLFVDRARQARPNFTLTAENGPTIAHLCSRLDGIPLAIELAAARVRSLPVERLAVELDQRFRLLTGGARTVIARQRTLQASIDWSYDLLDDDERLVLRRLSAFVGGFTLDAAEAVCADQDVDAYGLLDVLGRLVDKSLVQLDDGTGRYGLLETIRAYALDRAGAAAELASSRDCHLAWALDRTTAWAVGQVVPTHALIAEIDADYANLLAALEWSLEQDPAVELLGPLALVWAGTSRFAEAQLWTQRALDRLPEGSLPWARAIALSARAFLSAGGPPFGAELLPVAFEIAEREGDGWAASHLLLHWATFEGTTDTTTDSLDRFDEVLARLEAAGDEAGVLHALGLGTVIMGVACRTRRAEELVRRLDEHEVPDYCYEYLRGQGMAMVAFQTGRYEEGRVAVERALLTAPPAPRAGLSIFRGQLAVFEGDADAVEAALARLPPTAQLGTWEGWRLLLAGGLALLRGEVEEAVARANEARRVDVHSGLTQTAGVAQLLALAGEIDAAEAILSDAEPPHAEDDPAWTLNTLTTVGIIGLARGDTDAVERHALRDLEYNLVEGRTGMVLFDLSFLAVVAEPDRAVRLAGAVARSRDEIGHHGPLLGQLDDAVEAARAHLGEERFDELWAEGFALSPDEAAAYALRGRGSRGRPTYGWDSLTPTERAVVDLVAEGLTNSQIAERMLVEVSTVKTHVHHVFTKLDVRTRSELVAVTLRRADAG